MKFNERAEIVKFMSMAKGQSVSSMMAFNKNYMSMLQQHFDKQLIMQKQETLKGFYEMIKKEILESDIKSLNESSSYYFSKEGKLIRPLLNLMVYEYISPNQSRLNEQIVWAALIEMLHVSSLVHDDILDNAGTRRGLPTSHIVYGKEQATFSANYIIGRAGRKIAEFEKIGLFKIYSKIMDNLTNGEYLQALKQKSYGDYDETIANYLVKSYYKTGSLIANSLNGVCEVAGFEESEHEAFRVGVHLGICFQLIDDVLDYISDAQTLGKSNMSDLMEGVVTGPVLFEYFRLPSHSPEHRLIHKVIHSSAKDRHDVEQVNQIVQRGEGILKTQYLAMLHAEEALVLLDRLNPCPSPAARKSLLSLIYYILNRDK